MHSRRLPTLKTQSLLTTSSSSSTPSSPSDSSARNTVGHLLDRLGSKTNREQARARRLHSIYPGLWIAFEDYPMASGHPVLDRFGMPVELMRTPAGEPFTHVLCLSTRPEVPPSYNHDLHQVYSSVQLPAPNTLARWGIPDLTAQELLTARLFCGTDALSFLETRYSRFNALQRKANVLIVSARDKAVEAVALAADALAAHKHCTIADALEEIESELEEDHCAREWHGLLSSEGVAYFECIAEELEQDPEFRTVQR